MLFFLVISFVRCPFPSFKGLQHCSSTIPTTAQASSVGICLHGGRMTAFVRVLNFTALIAHVRSASPTPRASSHQQHVMDAAVHASYDETQPLGGRCPCLLARQLPYTSALRRSKPVLDLDHPRIQYRAAFGASSKICRRRWMGHECCATADQSIWHRQLYPTSSLLLLGALRTTTSPAIQHRTHGGRVRGVCREHVHRHP
jgi:hypothetical protein